jgi:tyrosine-protein kinase Etk/Wzc
MRKINFLDYIHVLVKWRKALILNFIIVCIFAVLVSLIVPKTYMGHSIILPSSDSGDMFGISSLLGDLPSSLSGLGLNTMSGESATFMAILTSRTVMDSVIRKFDLKKLYKTKTMVETRKNHSKNVGFSLNDEGTLSIATFAKTKYFSFGNRDMAAKILAKDMANYYVRLLEKTNKKLRSEHARNNRIFIENRYNSNLEDLVQAEELFKDFQEKYGAVALPEQTEAAIKAMAEIKSMVIAKEVEVNVLKNYLDESHSQYVNSKNELSELKKKYDQFIYHQPDNEAPRKDIFLPFEDIPELGLQYARVLREVMIQQKVQEVLLPLYEQAKIQEAKDMPTVQILDEAILPDKKVKPKRAFIVLLAAFAAIVFSFGAAYIHVNLENMKSENSPHYQQLANITKEFKKR